MEITWYGLSCFRLVEKGMAAVVTDPYDAAIGYRQPDLQADVVTISHAAPGHSNVAAIRDVRYAIRGPGEYEIGGVFVTGVMPDGERTRDIGNTIYVFDFGGLTVAHLGDLAQVPTQTQIETLGAVDIVLVPVGGGAGLNATQAAEIVSLIEPSIIVPMHYQTDSIALKLEPVSKFLKQMGLEAPPPEATLKITKSGLPSESKVVLLEPRFALS